MSCTGKRLKKERVLQALVEAGLKPIKPAVPALTLYELLVIACNYLKPDDPKYAYDLLYHRLQRIHAGVQTGALPPMSDTTQGQIREEEGLAAREMGADGADL